MKKIAFLLLFMTQMAQAADWVDSWFDNHVSHGASAFEGQQRGFYTAGGFSGRINQSNDYLMSLNMPKISSGCGGIDLFKGGMSFLDKEFLVNKMQSMMQAAPAVAFDIALKTMSKEFSDTLGKLDAATQWFNSLQLDDCAMTKRVVATVAKGDLNILGDVWSEITNDVSLTDAVHKNRSQVQQETRKNNGRPPIDLKKAVEGCPAAFTQVFKSGSVVENAAKKFGMKEYEDLIRGLIGDVHISFKKELPITVPVSRCAENNPEGLEDILYGEVYKKTPFDESAKCSKTNLSSVVGVIDRKLNNIANKISKGKPFGSDDSKFVSSANAVVLPVLKKAVLEGSRAQTIESLKDLVAVNYAKIIIDDLYHNIEYMLAKAKEIQKEPPKDSSNCRYEIYDQAIGEFDSLALNLKDVRVAVKRSYDSVLQSKLVALEYALLQQKEAKKLINKRSAKAAGRTS